MLSIRSRLAVSAAVLAAAVLLPLAANAAPKLTWTKPAAPATTSVSAESRTRTGVLGYGYYWTFVDYLRYFRNNRGNLKV